MTTRYTITPLGAAVVEALPKKQLVRRIERDFKRYKVCPVSELFGACAIRDFYQGKILGLPIHLYDKKLKGRTP